MPRWLRQYLVSADLRSHFKRALVIGFVLRALCAWFVYGPQALDDYKHGVWPAYQFFAGLPLDLPEYRSHLLVWFLAGFVKLASVLGFDSALGQVRAMYLGLGTTSLLGICGTYLYVKNFRSRLFGALALYLVAAFPLMPFVSTRAFGEAVAMSLVALGLGFLETARRSQNPKASWVRYGLYGFLFLGIATLFRFHVGLIYMAYVIILIGQKKWVGLWAGIVAGLFTLGAQALIDIWSGKVPLGTLLIYLSENEGGGAKYGVSPWYNPWLFVLMLTLAPFSFVLFRSIKNLWRKHWTVLVPFLIFVGAHSLVAHKEERFLYPIVALELWLLAFLWASNALNVRARRIYAPVF